MRVKVYPLADWYGRGLPKDVRAISTGIRRAPRKGEWYISGAIPEAYLAPSNLTGPITYIAKLVRTRVETRVVVLGDYKE